MIETPIFMGRLGRTQKKKLRERVIEQVISIYRSPPKLHPRFPRINSVPLGIRLRQSMTLLQQWIERIANSPRYQRPYWIMFQPNN